MSSKIIFLSTLCLEAAKDGGTLKIVFNNIECPGEKTFESVCVFVECDVLLTIISRVSVFLAIVTITVVVIAQKYTAYITCFTGLPSVNGFCLYLTLN